MKALRDDVQEALLCDLFDYWEKKRGAMAMPSRAQIDPAEIPKILPHLLLVDTAETLGEFRFRLFGTLVCEGFGVDRTGMKFGELPPIENYETVYEGYWKTYELGEPHYFPRRIVSQEQHYVSYSRLTLPLSNGGEGVEMILGGVVFYQTEHRSRWL